jgi:hypothetical protein
MITESETEIDYANMLGILEERLGDFSQLAASYDTVLYLNA